MYLAVFGCCNYSVLLILHWYLPPFCYVCWCEARKNFMLAYDSHHFFHLYQLSHISHLQSTLYCIYLLFIHFLLFPSDGKRASTIIGRGSSPRSRTDCDIFSFDSHVNCFTGGYGSWLFRRLMWFIQTAIGHFQYQS